VTGQRDLDPYVALAETSRSGFIESVHRGAVVALERDGSIAFAAGDPSVAVYPRSSTKLLLALAMMRAGLSLPPELLVLVCASHSGTPIHLAGVRRILATVGLDESALGNTPDLPLDPTSSRDVIRGGGGRTALQQNCSGKHAGMLATCVINGWPLNSYLDDSHPLQLAITAALPSMTEEAVVHIGIDGCGAPAHVMTLAGLARSFRNIVTGAAGDEARQISAAITSHPDLLGGPGRDVTELIRLVPGLVAKDGAEGVYAAALPDGRAVAIKIADGATRARPPVMLAALRALGVDVEAVEPVVRQVVLGHGHQVGQVAISAELEDALASR
jgi:L-asparaginase II